jgi:hypothetical protein
LVAGLKSITARHLGMAWQTISLLAVHAPLLRAALHRRLPPPQV